MNHDTFSPQRFGLYVRQYAGENWKKLTQMAATIIGIMIIMAAIMPVINDSYRFPSLEHDAMWDKETSMFWAVLDLFIIVAAGTMFVSMGSKAGRISILSTPASNLEKFLTCFLFYGVAVYILFFAGMIIADYLRVWTAPLYASEGTKIEPLPLSYFFSFGYKNDYMAIAGNHGDKIIKLMHLFAFSSLLILQSFFALASTIWPKNGRLRGALSGICIFIGICILMSISFKIMMSSGSFNPIKYDFKNIDDDMFITVGYIVSIAITIGTYLLAYLRFKEMESIERW